MNQHDIRFMRRVFFAALFCLCMLAIYLSTPPECFEDGPLPRYCVEG